MEYNNYNWVGSTNKITAMKTTARHFLLCLLLMIGFGATAQNNYVLGKADTNPAGERFYKVISFGEKIFFGKVENTTTWSVTNTAEKTTANLRGSEINEYVFEKAGQYEIRFFENKKHSDECNHPSFDEKMLIKVNPVKMTFDFSKIAFSEKIERGRNYDNLIITVPVGISTKDNSITKLAAPGLFIAGIGVSMKAKPATENVEIKNGVQLLTYQVSGIVNAESYLMFDFSDFNNQIHTYNLPQIIH
ncbi:hypothetical protein [Flavobacterium humi]|uniref:Uncharacterized protein n=1 Tax=Flavobacterium humi TaxID=2562683 RepID=A0A4Z0L5K2_9FLAO|nr:hypothetical protein [Flavobacterium humi]TGD57781.1 hypothetical protein E4635_11450 [Flavobacterium humi]